MKNIFSFLFVLSINLTLSFSQTVVPIQSIRMNDANGVPLSNNTVVTVSGVVTCSNQYGLAGPAAIQDETGAVSIYGNTFSNMVAIGDSVTLTATMTNYNGLAEISFAVGTPSFIKHSSNHSVEPEVVTINQISTQQWNGFEEFESKLIRINNVTINATGNFQSGTNYNITDATGSITQGLRIDNDVSTIIGTQIPAGQVDLIGILGQYDNAAPFSAGYQILPRFILDVVNDGSPVILNPVFAADIDTSSFKIFFNTARDGNSKVKYGLTTALELDSVIINNDTTYHVVPIAGLQSGTLYFYKAYSTNAFGTSSSGLNSVSTVSTDPTLGAMNVYFNFAVDQSVAISGNEAQGSVNFEQKLIERINMSNYSIDMALYSFADKPNIANALVVAKNRGVKIRVVYDHRGGAALQNSMQTLANAGILISRRPNETATFNGIMHNKFFIFDGRDAIANNDWVWTGSWNITALESNWENNVIEMNDPTIAQAYQIEFEEMWGSSTDTPNSSVAKFGYLKSNNTPHSFLIGGRPVQLYFSPSDGTTSKIINTINTANYNIYFAQYTFTRSDIENAIHQRYNAGVTDIRGLINQAGDASSQYANLDVYAEMFQNVGSTMHHKYGIIDPSYANSNPFTITGSHNWSSSAENDNDENTLIINDVYIANKFMQEFKKRYNEDGGTGTFTIPTTDVDDFGILEFDYHLYQNFPNPFNPVTTIRFEVPKSQKVKLSIYDVLGREVKVLYNEIAPAGIITVDFRADDFASGMYIYQLKSDNFSISKKMVLLK